MLNGKTTLEYDSC